MPIYHHFYVECRGPEGWVVPPRFEPESRTFVSDRPFGGFAWAHPRCGWLDLFFGPVPLFPMRSGAPDDPRGSPLLRHLDAFYDYSLNEDWLCWLPYQELFLDTWDADTVAVRTWVPARHALLFGNGRQEFPAAALRGGGVAEEELDRWRRGRLADGPVDVTVGRERFRIAGLPPDREVEVTWRESIATFVGEPHAARFKSLRQYGRDEELRILSMRG